MRTNNNYVNIIWCYYVHHQFVAKVSLSAMVTFKLVNKLFTVSKRANSQDNFKDIIGSLSQMKLACKENIAYLYIPIIIIGI